jgi:hypothetical protein
LERSQALIRTTADSLCSGKTRFLFRRFFEEQAMVFKLTANEEKARWSWILSQHLSGDAPAGENPAVFQLVMYSLKHYWPDEFDQKHPQTAQPHERRTDSGLILP